MKRHSKCHDCPYRERKGVCKVCRGEETMFDEATLRKKFARIRKAKREDD